MESLYSRLKLWGFRLLGIKKRGGGKSRVECLKYIGGGGGGWSGKVY